MSDISISTTRNTYTSLVECLISLLQGQIIQLIQTQRIERSWSTKFNAIYGKMVNFELKHIQDPKFSLSCKELFQYINQEYYSQRSSRTIERATEKKNTKSKPHSIFKHISIPTLINSDPTYTVQRKKTPSSYYSRIMNSFLQDNSPSKNKGKKKVNNLDEKDFWLLGDDIKFIE